MIYLLLWSRYIIWRPKDQVSSKVSVRSSTSTIKCAHLALDYYESCDQDHVEITDSPIIEFTETGIKTEDGKTHDFDIIAICTGYDAVTGGLRTMGIKGRGGVELDDNWNEGVTTHLGMMVNGYPNMYFIYGPQGKRRSPSLALAL